MLIQLLCQTISVWFLKKKIQLLYSIIEYKSFSCFQIKTNTTEKTMSLSMGDLSLFFFFFLFSFSELETCPLEKILISNYMFLSNKIWKRNRFEPTKHSMCHVHQSGHVLSLSLILESCTLSKFKNTCMSLLPKLFECLRSSHGTNKPLISNPCIIGLKNYLIR